METGRIALSWRYQANNKVIKAIVCFYVCRLDVDVRLETRNSS